jgi:hypothetical protein
LCVSFTQEGVVRSFIVGRDEHQRTVFGLDEPARLRHKTHAVDGSRSFGNLMSALSISSISNATAFRGESLPP